MEIAEFLLARIAEDEAAARAATSGPWRHNPGKEWHTDPEMPSRARAGQLTFDGEEFVGAGPTDSAACVAATGPADDLQSMADAAQIARWHPPRVLAECEAKRQVISSIASTDPNLDPPSTFILGDDVLWILALPYVGHPDYNPEWRP